MNQPRVTIASKVLEEPTLTDAADCTNVGSSYFALLDFIPMVNIAALEPWRLDLEHLKPFEERDVVRLEPVNDQGWRLKRYAILADGKAFDEDVAAAATDEALNRLPDAGSLENEVGNHGIGFQIIHFAETAVVSPVFYWQWGSVRAGTQLVREWNGRRYQVEVTDDGFRMNGEQFRSLSAIALRITGTNWSGPRFFGLNCQAGAGS